MLPRPLAALFALGLALLCAPVRASEAPAPAAVPAAADTAAGLLADEDLWSCARGPGLGGALACLETRAMRLLDAGARQAEEEAKKNGELPFLERVADLGADLMPAATEALVSSDADEAEGSEDAEDKGRSAAGLEEEGRGKKKKKRKALMKLLFVAMLIKNKLGLLFQGFGALLQIKFFGIAILQLILTLFRLYLELAKKKEPQKVIYYEHAQHQHHYEHEHHYDDEKGGWGGLWGRSYEEPPQGAAPRPGSGPDAQEQAYSSYLPRSV